MKHVLFGSGWGQRQWFIGALLAAGVCRMRVRAAGVHRQGGGHGGDRDR